MTRNVGFYTNTALRLLLGITFMMHGIFKLEWGYGGLTEWLHSQGFPLAELFGYVLPWIELLGGILVLIGAGTRYVAALFSLILLVALLKVKLGAGFISSSATGYEFELLLLAVSVHVAATAPNSLKDVWVSLFERGNNGHVQSNQ
ncbi:DoxX family protein [Paenibacillus mesophilus]|uniref:DoxX family protein n=1 Tax=Paenibacillus mesophilus TaxID=2582849 RepID=UPI001EE4850A|nr:DoxX family protein [Paenibacillus mesophilus]